MFQDALTQAKKEAAAWPYDWVTGVDYPHKSERGRLTGQLVLNDSQASTHKLHNLLVGLAFPDQPKPAAPLSAAAPPSTGPAAIAPAAADADSKSSDSTSPAADRSGNVPPDGQRGGRGFGSGFGGGRFGPQPLDWQNDAKHYEFWVQGDVDGHFVIPNIRPGTYQLHAIADGVLGEFSQQPIEIKPGQSLDLGKLEWKPVRYGKQVWDIGFPNRTGAEFFKGDEYFRWGWYVEYPKLFPNDVHYEVGKSDYTKDWFFEQVPHDTKDDNVTGQGQGRATPWTISFDLPDAPKGKATLRLAICGCGTRSLDVTVNDAKAGTIVMPPYNATINRDGIGGYWSERNLAFDASLMHAGQNSLILTVPAGSLTSGVIYDYLRLELDESAAAPQAQ
jgi:rhamnogalacturonan endolyase